MTGKTQRYSDISQLLTMPSEVPAGASDDVLLGLVEDAAIVVDGDGRISWLGPRREAPAADEEVTLGGVVVLPALVDCHTHLVYAGDRANDFASRCSGQSYAQIAERGGGIRTTVAATRAAGHDALAALARPRLAALLRRGVASVEIKSGYGLSYDDELKQLEVVDALRGTTPQRLHSTLLAAHIVPDEYATDRDAYLRLVTERLIPEVSARGLASAVDVFCDRGAFTLQEARTVLETAGTHGLALRVHGEQLSHTGIARLAAELGAASVDHLEHVAQQDIEALSAAGTAAVLLPSASVYLGDVARPPARALIEAGVRVALATDSNPGSSPTTDIWLIVTLGSCWYGLSPARALRAVTVEAAHVLRADAGTLKTGRPADFVVTDASRWQRLVYRLGHNPVRQVLIDGRQAYNADTVC